MGKFKDFISNVPYATITATVFLFLGLIIAGIAANRGLSITSTTLRSLLKKDLNKFDYRVSTAKASIIIFEVLTSVTAILTLIFGILATGVTRGVIYRNFGTSLGGRITCIVLMVLNGFQLLLWLIVFWCLSAVVMTLGVAANFCLLYGNDESKVCQKLIMLDIFHPNDTIDGLSLCTPVDKKKFCKDFVEKSTPLFVMCGCGTFFIMISLIGYLTCLSANYVKIGSESKIRELEDISRLGSGRPS